MRKKGSRFPRWFIPAALLISLLFTMIPGRPFDETALAETPPSIQWSQTFGDTDGDYAYCVQQTADGGYVVTGYTNSYGAGLSDVWLIKTDASGNQQWAKTFGGSDNDIGFSVQQTADGGYVVAGHTFSYGNGGGLSDVWLIKTDASGNQQWAQTFGGSDDDVGLSVQQTADGGYVVAGSTNDAAGGDILLIKTDASGNQQWAQTFGGVSAGESCSSVQELSGGGYVLAGGTNSYGAGGTDLWLVWTDASGNMTWNVTEGGTGDDVGLSVRRTAGGDFVVAGYTNSPGGAGGNDAWLIRTDSMGSVKWTETYGGTGDDRGYSLQLAPDGGFVVAGYTNSPGGAGGSDFWLFKTDSSGIQQWAKTFGGPGDEYGQSVEYCAADGSYVLTGGTRSYGAGGYDFWLVKTTDCTPPPAPTLLSPANEADTADNTPLLDWSDVTDPSGVVYWVQVDTYSHFPSPIVNLPWTPSEYTLPSALADGQYYWRVYARDNAGNYSPASAVWSFTVDSTAPPEVATAAASGTGSTVATLNGILAELGSAASVEVSFEWGLTAGYGSATPPLPVTAPGEFNTPLEGLTPETTYHFRAKATGDGTVYGDDMTFTTDVAATTPPEVATTAATRIGTTTATLNGNLSGLGTASPVEVFFEWGLTAAYGNSTTPQAMTATGAFSASLSSLTLGNTYHFRAVAMGDGTVYGDDMTFTTDTATTTPPEIATSPATGIGSTVATLNGSLTGMGTASPVEVSFEWGLTVAYGNATAPQAMTGTGAFNFPLEGLTPETTYHFRAKAEGDGTVYGDDMAFTTDVATTTPPEVATTAASGIGTTTATLNGNLDSLGTASPVEASFEWGLTAGYGNATAPQTMTATGAFSASLGSLTPETTYHFRAKAVGDGTVYGDDMTFTTDAAAADTMAPVISLVSASGISASGATVTWATDEPATTRVEYGLTDEYGSFTTLDADLVTSHSVELTGLKAGQTYHYRVISTDAAGNETVSPDFTLETPGSPGGMPAWVWVIIGLAAAAVVGAAAFFIKGRLAKT